MTRHVMRHTQEKPFRCPYCPHRFSRNDALKNHIKIHVTENPLQCTDCKFMATTLEDLKNHEKQDHKHACSMKTGINASSISGPDQVDGENSIVPARSVVEVDEVNDVDLEISVSTSTAVHDVARLSPASLGGQVITVDGSKELRCKLCPYETRRRQHLERHVLRHTNERPFVCPHCLRRFSRKDSLTKHVSTHAGDTPGQCVYCCHMASDKKDLENHMKEKHIHFCKVCRRKFPTNKTLRGHEAKHCKFGCKHCVFSSIFRNKVERHVRLEHNADDESVVVIRLLSSASQELSEHSQRQSHLSQGQDEPSQELTETPQEPLDLRLRKNLYLELANLHEKK
ncbi:zinc finger protein 26-like [Varroa jacobsoni]|uniref:C2H2-type domain-containing protein n=1 Tax=Varroa destructor TaxID=109461 RepID=A0A7M7J7G3_VARDE|nr:zinc finger Y-chromosomal protein-like [Varroa destructor]XP_022698227.1 zinc finger protein 26-like [Varroa jacobsoni]